MTVPSLAAAPSALREAVAALAATPEVQGILLVGSRSRGDADGRADFDLLVVVDDAFYARLKFHMRVALVWDGAPYRSRLLGDTLTVSQSELAAKRHSPLDSDHWPFESAQLWHDRDGALAALVAALAAFPESAWEPRLKLHYIEFWLAAARASQLAEKAGTLDAALLLAQAVQGYCRFLFVLNRRWPPSAHATEWAVAQRHLPWQPADDGALLSEALLGRDPLALHALLDALDPLLERAGLHWQQDRFALLMEVMGPAFQPLRERWGARP